MLSILDAQHMFYYLLGTKTFVQPSIINNCVKGGIYHITTVSMSAEWVMRINKFKLFNSD